MFDDVGDVACTFKRTSEVAPPVEASDGAVRGEGTDVDVSSSMSGVDAREFSKSVERPLLLHEKWKNGRYLDQAVFF